MARYCEFERIDNGVKCKACGISVQTRRPPEQVHSACKAPLNRELTWLGRLLIRLEPGDALADIARISGTATLAKLWESITQQSCGCEDRQRWLNRQWERFVWEHFSVSLSSGDMLQTPADRTA